MDDRSNKCRPAKSAAIAAALAMLFPAQMALGVQDQSQRQASNPLASSLFARPQFPTFGLPMGNHDAWLMQGGFGGENAARYGGKFNQNAQPVDPYGQLINPNPGYDN